MTDLLLEVAIKIFQENLLKNSNLELVRACPPAAAPYPVFSTLIILVLRASYMHVTAGCQLAQLHSDPQADATISYD